MKKMLSKVVRSSVDFFRGFGKEERGASELVTVVSLIVIVLAVALIFKDQLINIVNAVGAKVTSWISNG